MIRTLAIAAASLLLGNLFSAPQPAIGQPVGPWPAPADPSTARGPGRGDPSPPQIVEQPRSRVMSSGSNYTLLVIAIGEPLSYEWYKDGEPLGVNTPTLEILGAGPEDNGRYQAAVFNIAGEARSEFALIHVQDLPLALANPAWLPPVVVPTPRVPVAWRAPDFQWVRDGTPHNKIDDEIDAPGAVEPFDIIVNLRRTVTPEILSDLELHGSIELVGSLLPSVFVNGVSLGSVQGIAAWDDVAFIELQRAPALHLDVATQTTKVTLGPYSPCTVQDQFAAVDGFGVNIAIMDTGVDDPGGPGVTHVGLPRAAFAYDATTQTFSNPDDGVGHGTHVAAIALGRGTAQVARGVAPAAELIDVAIFNPAGVPASSARIYGALQLLVAKHISWNVGVINMSFGWPGPSDGTEAFSQLVDYAASLGIVVVASAGNSGPGSPIGYPASANGAITVANSNDLNTPDRTDDVLAASSTRGPRADNQNGICIDELKPEVAAPGSNIFSALHDSFAGGINRSGTSMSAPHVAGVAALMRGHAAAPGLSPYVVKQLLVVTAEARGVPTSPACNPQWNDGWGWGLIDAEAGVEYAVLAGAGGCAPAVAFTDLGFAYGPAAWGSDMIGVASPPQVGVPNTISATLTNGGPADASNVTVRFELHDLVSANPSFQFLGVTVLPFLAVGATDTVSIPWTPVTSGHWCLKAYIDYFPDPNPNNNVAQRNIDIAQSPVYFQVCNHVRDEPIDVQLLAQIETPGSLWSVSITPPSVNLGPGECTTVEALPLPPFGAPDGEQERIWISAWTDGNSVLLGGIGIDATMKDCNGNGIDDWFDIRDGTSLDLDGNRVPDECEQCPAGPACEPGDVDGNCAVNLADLSALLSSFGCAVPSSCYEPAADFDNDEDVDLADLSSLLGVFGLNCN